VRQRPLDLILTVLLQAFGYGENLFQPGLEVLRERQRIEPRPHPVQPVLGLLAHLGASPQAVAGRGGSYRLRTLAPIRCFSTSFMTGVK
jgi:hypothetical protein